MFDETARRLGLIPDRPVDATHAVPTVGPVAGENDELVEPTDNRLRLDDWLHPQPPQNSGWTP